MDDNEFTKNLRVKGLDKKYKNEVGNLRKQLRKDLKNQDKQLVNSLTDELRQMELHDQLVCMSIFPFIQNSSLSALGYQFIRSAPLLELDVKNLDFLIYRKQGKKSIAIFGEAKTSTKNKTKILNEFKERKKIVEKNKSYILQNYLGNTSEEVLFEYVLTVFSSDAAKMKESIEQDEGGFILWSADLAFSDLRLEGSRKPETRVSMSHYDSELSRTLNKIGTSKKAAIMLQQSHIITKMKSLITIKEWSNAMNANKLQEFSSDDMNQYFDKVFFYLDEKSRKDEISEIVRCATELKILNFDNSNYNIITTAKNIRSQEKELENKWIQFKVQINHQKFMEDEINKLREKYLNEDKKQPSLFDYPDKN